MGTRMIRDRSGDGGWWLMLGMFTLCVVGWSLVFSWKAAAAPTAPVSEPGAGVERVADRVWHVTDFDRIAIAGSPAVQLVQGNAEGVYGHGDSEDLERLEVVVEGRELIVRPRRQGRLWGWSDDDVKLVIEFRDLSQLKMSGSGELNAAALATPELSLRVSGSGDIDIEELAVQRLDLSISGSADVDLSGTTDDQSVKISGSADYTAANLRSQSARVRISGSADARIQVSNRLEAKVSGSGSVRYAGDPEVTQQVSGSGEVRPL